MLAQTLSLSEDPERILVRPRLVNHLADVVATSQVVLLPGPPGIGRSTALHQWISSSGRPWLSAEDRPDDEVVAAAHEKGSKGLVVIGVWMARDNAPALIERLVSIHERIRVVVRGGPDFLRETAILTDILGEAPASVNPDVFHLTRSEIGRLADQRNVKVTDRDVAEIHRTTGGYGAVLTMVLDQAASPERSAAMSWTDASGTAFTELVAHVGVERMLTPTQLALADVLSIADQLPLDAAVELAHTLGRRGTLRELQAFRLLGRDARGDEVGILPGFRQAIEGGAWREAAARRPPGSFAGKQLVSGIMAGAVKG